MFYTPSYFLSSFYFASTSFYATPSTDIVPWCLCEYMCITLNRINNNKFIYLWIPYSKWAHNWVAKLNTCNWKRNSILRAKHRIEKLLQIIRNNDCWVRDEVKKCQVHFFFGREFRMCWNCFDFVKYDSAKKNKKQKSRIFGSSLHRRMYIYNNQTWSNV